MIDTAGDSSEIMKLRKQVAEYASQSEKDIAKIRELQQEREQKTATLTNATESLELAQKKYSQLDTDHEMLSRETENLKKELEAAKGLAAKRDGELTDLRTEKSRVILL